MFPLCHSPFIKILVVGDERTGKTSIAQFYVQNKINEAYETTLGVEFYAKSENFGGQQIRIQIFDIAGQEKFQPYMKSLYKGVQVVLLVFDITNYSSFVKIKSILLDIKSVNKEHLICLVGNKSDLLKIATVSFEEALNLACQNQIIYFQVSAKKGFGIIELIRSVIIMLSRIKSEKEVNI